MPEAIPMALRQRVLADCDAGLKTKAVATKFKVSASWVRRLKQHRRERGDIIPRKGGGARLIKIDRKKLADAVARRPDATLLELAEMIGVRCGKSAIHKALAQLKISYKKSRSTPPSRTGPTSRANARHGG